MKRIGEFIERSPGKKLCLTIDTNFQASLGLVPPQVVITSYSIHYTKLYEVECEAQVPGTFPSHNDPLSVARCESCGATESLDGVGLVRPEGVMTSYRIHYTKLYGLDVG